MSINISAVRSTVPLVDGGLNVANNQAVQNTGRQVKGAEFVLTLGIRNGRKFITRNVTFSCVARGRNTETTVTLDNLLNGASIIASNIAAMSRGTIFGLFMKCGKYRNDENTPNYQSVPKLGASLRFDNIDVTLNECGNPVSGISPLRTVSQNLYIPFLSSDISLATIEQTLSTPVSVSDNVDVALGVTRFDLDGEKESISAYQTLHSSKGHINKSDRVATIDFLNIDTVLGDSDDIVSEKYNTVQIVNSQLPTPPEHSN